MSAGRLIRRTKMSKLILVSDTKKQRETCKGCTFLKGTKANPSCEDEGFIISNQHGFKGGCDNPRLTSGVFMWVKDE